MGNFESFEYLYAVLAFIALNSIFVLFKTKLNFIFQISYMATDRLFPEWKIWTQFLQATSSGLGMDALEGSHPIEVRGGQWFSFTLIFCL